jgi:hypothetical protein
MLLICILKQHTDLFYVAYLIYIIIIQQFLYELLKMRKSMYWKLIYDNLKQLYTDRKIQIVQLFIHCFHKVFIRLYNKLKGLSERKDG